MRKAGVLLPVTSLPSNYGIGCFSGSAYTFVDWLVDAGQSYWQILPLTQTGYGDSPYQSPSSYAGNPYMISLEALIEEELLTKEECDKADLVSKEESVDYKKQYENRYPLLRKAFSRFRKNTDFRAFKEKNADWLDDYALFMAIKDSYGGLEWQKWDEKLRKYDRGAIERFLETGLEETEFYKFLQFKFFEQWGKLKKYANQKGVLIIGDIPIYSAMDSADVWANQEYFKLSEDGLPTEVAGCPPDGFSPKGQLWGNPVYDWEKHKADDYGWWVKRIQHSFDMYDLLRIDHFRGFDEYYAIPYGNTDATEGKWEKGPGMDLFDKLKAEVGDKEIIAEDLGFVTPSVKKLLKDTGYAGMKVLEFAFDNRDTGETNDYLPHNYPNNCIAYTGTHDNQTLYSWLMESPEDEILAVRKYLCNFYTPTDKLVNPLISVLMMSSAKICIVPIGDYLSLSDNARINKPSTVGSNWKWRLKKGELTEKKAGEVYEMTKRYGRNFDTEKAT